MRSGTLLLALVAVAPLLAPAAPASAAEQPPAGEQFGWHIVRPGENLIGITAKYLGTGSRWRENWRLNPKIQNPDVLEPGERIRVLLAVEKAPPTARLKTISGRVEEQPSPIPWNRAREEDLLVERDGLRTYESSSSEMEFLDGGSLLLTEESLIFFRRSGRTLTGVEKKSVEIVEGQAELQARSPVAAPAEVEIVVGATRAVSRRGEDGIAQARARRPASGGARVMVYEGSGEVESGGAKVEVERGMGTAVEENLPPSPPEKLLPSPAPLVPAAGSEWWYPDPEFSWSAVDGAASYTVEICSDPACAALVERAVGVREPSWRSDPLPVASLHWRITAVSPSGLDGYPSESLAFAVLSDQQDREPPVGAVKVAGESRTVGSELCYGPGAAAEVTVEDRLTGVESWRPLVDGSEADAGALAGPWTTGVHTVGALAVDRAGNRGEIPSVSFEVDAEPPGIGFQIRGVEEFERWIGSARSFHKRRQRGRDKARRTSAELAAAPLWTVLAWGREVSPEAASPPAVLPYQRHRTMRLSGMGGNALQILLLAPGLKPDPGAPSLDEDQILLLELGDRGCATLEELTLRTAPAAAPQAYVLRVEAADLLGNRRRVEWPFE